MRVIPVLLLFLVLAACGSPTTPAAGGSHGAQPPPRVVLTDKDFGRTISVSLGTTIELNLPEQHPVPGSSSTWTATSSDPAVLRLDSESRSPSPRPVGNDTYTADFTALASGEATIRARNPRTCEAMNPAACPAGTGGTIKIRVR